jgi:hypothetical protein
LVVLWNDDFLFLHYPKTAGKSLSVAFMKSWRTPVRGYISLGQLTELGLLIQHGSELWIHGSHQSLEEAAIILKEHNRRLDQFRAIFVAVRCPYDMMYSAYRFRRARAHEVAGRDDFSLAVNSTYEEYVERERILDYRSWLQYENKNPSNLRVIRFEKMLEDYRTYAQEFGFRNAIIPHLNATPGGSYLDVLSPKIEEAIYGKYRILFERGYYSRLSI